MFDNVLVGVDGTPSGRDAAALANKLADEDARVTLAHVHHSALIGGRQVRVELDAASRPDDVQRLLEAERECSPRDTGLLSVSAPSTGHGLHALAEEREADLLVVGSSHRGFVGRVMLGDDTRASLNGAPCAVAISPRAYAFETSTLASIGVGYDFSEQSTLALAAARNLATRDRATLCALCVVSIPSGAYVASLPGDWNEELEEQRKRIEKKITSKEKVEGKAVWGPAVHGLAAFSGDVDLLVLGSRSYGPIKRLIFGTTASRLARQSRSPLLVLPHAAC